MVLAEVVKCEEKGGSGQRSIAVSFTYISDEDRQLLRDHVDAILRTQGGEEVEARA